MWVCFSDNASTESLVQEMVQVIKTIGNSCLNELLVARREEKDAIIKIFYENVERAIRENLSNFDTSCKVLTVHIEKGPNGTL